VGSRRERPLRRERGAAALEFVFIVPVLLLLVAAVMTLGLASYSKFRMSDAAMVASRRCVIANPATCGATASALFNERWPDGARVCAGGPAVTATVGGGVATVQARCTFTGGVMQGFIGLSNLNVTTSAATPF